MAGRLDAESNDIAAQITDYNSTECEQTALARPDWRGQQNLHASYSFVLPEGSDFEDETRYSLHVLGTMEYMAHSPLCSGDAVRILLFRVSILIQSFLPLGREGIHLYEQ
ncbi:hypothetical protein H103_06843 [Trichophyton rubrum CBS 288.86]|uniref:Uncharacterized protein n=1 Tax=Trichophyton rubrum CBS 288.86 TaxID=1215330 RepID=A0A022VUM9_TRIRU|nr:hypothetical protein H100_06858 [Trichophyton rubrum MR850]EZF39068.1 hypothetical protein H102_06818 [Trichophyton rubrum CBS 100081]EZF49634.1 hypothetical protein H103_06843 [Trichophyton rubrum CBS 288.86]EZF60345.1 hypothetical protein H104_06796 [Trichophyton rubrum CBS 289.86]EZF81619.1 hypothetical protein H110_06837 [Trichophyton rubrum MR1448]EZG03187.1 hypothetical protein H106_06688 [Trichophyton rubrum CBS 735.88]EZG13841.1 hypothetical protein H107_06998 [Trichophyton rubrum 